MQLSFNVDGYTCLVEFAGRIDIARTLTNEVALRRVSDDARLSIVSVERLQSVVDIVTDRMDRYFAGEDVGPVSGITYSQSGYARIAR